MAQSRQLKPVTLRLHMTRTKRAPGISAITSGASRELALIVGYQAMALINRDLAQAFTPCEEEAERRLTQFRRAES
ncbi:hypothetical protein L3X07_07545 [Levilactobacillus brevis]|nr:hypothetical protein [Levilactobacillus brevis]